MPKLAADAGDFVTWRPGHAYVPGKSARHAEGLFEPMKAGIQGVSAQRLNETGTWVLAKAFLADGYFWEAHELFEALWMACPPNSPEKLMIQALIQVSNAGLKRRMGLGKAAAKLGVEAERLGQEATMRAKGPVLGITSPAKMN